MRNQSGLLKYTAQRLRKIVKPATLVGIRFQTILRNLQKIVTFALPFFKGFGAVVQWIERAIPNL